MIPLSRRLLSTCRGSLAVEPAGLPLDSHPVAGDNCLALMGIHHAVSVRASAPRPR
uniref:Uncharacterized protein n=1 Tax=uncultured marine virus TaxID=186617 RepID=A0A0F7L6P5_9VIRU|nr:hypothetical protein [uncultured marine virus]